MTLITHLVTDVWEFKFIETDQKLREKDWDTYVSGVHLIWPEEELHSQMNFRPVNFRFT